MSSGMSPLGGAEPCPELSPCMSTAMSPLAMSPAMSPSMSPQMPQAFPEVDTWPFSSVMSKGSRFNEEPDDETYGSPFGCLRMGRSNSFVWDMLAGMAKEVDWESP